MGKVQLALKINQNTDFVQRDLSPWDAQDSILQNTGIERDGGITNLYTEIESNSAYAETYFGKNGTRIRLQYDSVNDNMRVFTGTRDIGQVPVWAVSQRKLIASDANDVCATIDGTLLILRISQSLATIEEVDEETLERINIRSFAIGSTISDGMFVRNKAPTWASVTSIVGIYAVGNVLNYQIILDSGVAYTPTGQLGFTQSAQVFGYYENGWITGAQQETTPQVYLHRSDGTQEGTIYTATYTVVNHNRGTGVVTFNSWRDPIAAGSPVTTYGYTFTPPATLGGAWTATALTDGSISSPAVRNFTFGGFALGYGAAKQLAFYNQSTPRTWTVGHSKMPEIYGWLDKSADIVFKVHTILGEAGYLSASFNVDGIGVPITEVGELNAYYYPQIVKLTSGDYRVIYRRGNGSYALIDLSKSLTIKRMQEIAPGVVKINTISALSIADANDNDLQYSGNAYNGFVIVGFSGGTATAKAYVARYRGDYGGSVDTGYKDVGSVYDIALVVVPEGASYSPNNETIDVYVGAPPSSLTYYRSLRDGIAQSIKSSLRGTLYVDDQVIPPPIGAMLSEQSIELISTTALRNAGYDGYNLGNEAVGIYQSFRLFGNLYFFDGDWIHLVVLNGTTIQRVDHIANANGLVFLAESPNAIFFSSSFDNSVYNFDGGQSVNKLHRYNRADPIWGACYNTRENTLALFSDGSVYWVRDGLISQTHLPFAAPFDCYSTSDGIWLVKDKYSLRYSYNPVALGSIPVIALDLDGGIWGTAYTDIYDGGTWGTPYSDTIDGEAFGGQANEIEPLTWQSKFLGIDERTAQVIERVLFRFYKEDKAQTDTTITYDYYNEEGQFTESQTFTVGDLNNPWDSDGYAFIEFVPAQKRSIGASFTMTCPEKIVFLDSWANVTELASNVAKNRK